jgi:hypothetical protein
MVNKQDTQGLFTSFKEILNKVQKDVTLGIEIIRLRSQYEGALKVMRGLYRDLGQKVFELYKDKKDPMPAIREMYEEMQNKEKEISLIKTNIELLEANTSSRAAVEKKPVDTSDDREEKNVKDKKPTPKRTSHKPSAK